MIKVTHFGKNGGPHLINAEEIETVEPVMDGTIITLKSGNKFRTAEPLEEVQRLVIEYKRSMFESLLSSLQKG